MNKLEGYIISDRLNEKESYIKVYKDKNVAILMKHEREVLQKVIVFFEKEKTDEEKG